MVNCKAIEMLKALSIWELKAMEKFVQSPFHNPNAQVTALFNNLNTYYPDFQTNAISYASLSCKLFHSKRPDVPKFRHLLTELTRLLENFYCQLALEANEQKRKNLLAQELIKRNLDKILLQQLTISKHSHQPKKDIAYYENQTALSEIRYEFTSSRQNRQPEKELQSLSDNLDHFYVAKKLKYCCEMLNRANIMGTQHSIPMLQPLMSYLTNNRETTPIIAIYHQILLTITDHKNEKHFEKLKTLLHKHTRELTTKENRDIYAFAQNYCIKQLNTGNTNYLKELFIIYKTVLEEQIIFDNSMLSHADFKNICAVGIRLQELKWVEEFIISYQRYLSLELRKNSVNYNTARLLFARNQPKPAIKLLTTVEFTDVFYHLDAKMLLLKIYYDNRDYEPLYALINSFKIYLKRSKLLSDYQRTIYYNFLTKAKLLAQLSSGDKLINEKIKATLLQNTVTADVSWINEKTKTLLPLN